MSGDYRHFTDRFVALLRDAGLPPVTAWRNISVRNGKPDRLAEAIEAQPASPPASGKGPIYLQFELGEGLTASTKFHPRWGDSALCVAELRRVTRPGDGIAALIAFQEQCRDVCHGLLREFHLYSAELRPNDGGAICIPDVPLVSVNSHFVVTNKGEIGDFYDQPEEFQKAGWSLVEERDGQRLLARDLDVVAGPELLRRIIDPQWAMARAAKPNETRYEKPYLTPEEMPIFRAGDKTLHFIGYNEEKRLIEYSCALVRGQHVNGWEIFALLGIITDKKLDGAPVDTVRIVFLEEWAARQEKRPLLDIGCRVFHFDDNGEQCELTE